MSRTKRIYNRDPRYFYGFLLWNWLYHGQVPMEDGNIYQWKTQCRGHCRGCRHMWYKEHTRNKTLRRRHANNSLELWGI